MYLWRPRAARKRGHAGWRRLRIAYAAEERTGYCSRRHRCIRKTPTYTSMQGARRRCPARKGPPWRGRGEATWDCTATESPSRAMGCGDSRQLLLGPEITERPTPKSLGPFLEVPALLTMRGIRSTETGSECDIEHRRSHRAARQDLVDIALRRTPRGGCRSGRGFLPAVFLT